MNITANDLRRAATIKDQIDALKNEFSKILEVDGVGNGRTTSIRVGRKSRRKMSAAARAKIAAAQRARWLKWKAAHK